MSEGLRGQESGAPSGEHGSGVWVRLDEAASTNSEAAVLAASGVAHGTVVIAEHQTQGRGRRGRVWETRKGDAVTLSVILRPALLPSERVHLVALMAALAVAEVAGPEAGIKWPNDVLCPKGGKLAGVLCEASFKGKELDYAVVGIGVNVHGAPEGVGATSLDALSGAPQDREQVATQVVEGLLRWLGELEHRPARALEAWSDRCIMWGATVEVDGTQGVARGIDQDGALIVETEGGEMRVVSGEVGLIQHSGSSDR